MIAHVALVIVDTVSDTQWQLLWSVLSIGCLREIFGKPLHPFCCYVTVGEARATHSFFFQIFNVLWAQRVVGYDYHILVHLSILSHNWLGSALGNIRSLRGRVTLVRFFILVEMACDHRSGSGFARTREVGIRCARHSRNVGLHQRPSTLRLLDDLT